MYHFSAMSPFSRHQHEEYLKHHYSNPDTYSNRLCLNTRCGTKCHYKAVANPDTISAEGTLFVTPNWNTLLCDTWPWTTALSSDLVLISLPHTALQISEGKSHDMTSFERADHVKSNDNLQDPEIIFLRVFFKRRCSVSENFWARL